MRPGLPCPNPACEHVFTATTAGPEALTCPRCGRQVSFHAAPATGPQPADLFSLASSPSRPPRRRTNRRSRIIANYAAFAVFLLALAIVGFKGYRWYMLQRTALVPAGQLMTARRF